MTNSQPWVGVIDERADRDEERAEREERERRAEAAATRAAHQRIAQLVAQGRPVNPANLFATPSEITADAVAALNAQDRADAARSRREEQTRLARRQEQQEAALTAEHARLVALGDVAGANAVFQRILALP